MTRREGVALVLLVALSAWLRTRSLDGALWIDEAISHGIASHDVTEIPAVLRLDGSPPLYYWLLHAWSGIFGDGEAALRALSAVAATAAVPAALWAGTAVAGRRAGWLAALLAALNPFLTIYAQEARMYALVALLSLLACATFVRGFVDGEGRHRALFAVVLTALLYTHAWAIFLGLGFAVAAAVQLRGRLREAALPFAAAALAFAPWLPTLLDQVRNTGAPWSKTPSLPALLGGIPGALDGGGGAAAVIAVGAVGLARLRRDDRAARAALLLAGVAGLALVAAWLSSHVEPSWANRYLAIIVGPVVVVAGAGLARAGRLGLVAAAAVSLFWLGFDAPRDKSNARAVAATAGILPSGTLVVSTQPEQVPLLAYYFDGDRRFATPVDADADPRVVDWRDALDRLRAVSAADFGRLAPCAGARHLALVYPIGAERGWDAPWQREVRRVTDAWRAAAAASSTMRLTRTVRAARVPGSRTDVAVTLYRCV